MMRYWFPDQEVNSLAYRMAQVYVITYRYLRSENTVAPGYLRLGQK